MEQQTIYRLLISLINPSDQQMTYSLLRLCQIDPFGPVRSSLTCLAIRRSTGPSPRLRQPPRPSAPTSFESIWLCLAGALCHLLITRVNKMRQRGKGKSKRSVPQGECHRFLYGRRRGSIWQSRSKQIIICLLLWLITRFSSRFNEKKIVQKIKFFGIVFRRSNTSS